jgi:hypothetical protein
MSLVQKSKRTGQDPALQSPPWQTAVFYHITPVENLPSIKQNGLKPRVGQRAQQDHANEARVYLYRGFENLCDDACTGHFGAFIEGAPVDQEWAVLLVVVPRSLMESVENPDNIVLFDDSTQTWVSRVAIPRRMISVLTTNFIEMSEAELSQLA